MRLLHATTQEFHEFQGSNVPPYAILSHRWEDGEVSYQDMKNGERGWKKKQGRRKVKAYCCQAIMDGLTYLGRYLLH